LQSEEKRLSDITDISEVEQENEIKSQKDSAHESLIETPEKRLSTVSNSKTIEQENANISPKDPVRANLKSKTPRLEAPDVFNICNEITNNGSNLLKVPRSSVRISHYEENLIEAEAAEITIPLKEECTLEDNLSETEAKDSGGV
jgi:hypothetical protein